MDRCQKLFGTRGPAAVMRHLQHIGRLNFTRLQHPTFDLPFRVAAQQEGVAPVSHAQHQ